MFLFRKFMVSINPPTFMIGFSENDLNYHVLKIFTIKIWEPMQAKISRISVMVRNYSIRRELDYCRITKIFYTESLELVAEASESLLFLTSNFWIYLTFWLTSSWSTALFSILNI